MLPAVDAPLDQLGFFQDFQVLGNSSQRDMKGFGDVAHGERALGELAQDLPASGVGEGPEDCIKVRLHMFNHVVDYSRASANCQLNG